MERGVGGAILLLLLFWGGGGGGEVEGGFRVGDVFGMEEAKATRLIRWVSFFS